MRDLERLKDLIGYPGENQVPTLADTLPWVRAPASAASRNSQGEILPLAILQGIPCLFLPSLHGQSRDKIWSMAARLGSEGGRHRGPQPWGLGWIRPISSPVGFTTGALQKNTANANLSLVLLLSA